MENSSNPSSSSLQDVAQSAEKKSLSNKSTKKMSPMKAANTPGKMQKSKKQVALSESLKKKGAGKVFKKSLVQDAKQSALQVKAAKNQGATMKKSASSSAKGLEKTRAASNRATLDSLMAGFQSGQGKTKTAMGMPLKDFSESAVSLLLSNYKVENEKVLSTTALAMSAEASEDKTLSSLERYQQFFTEEKMSTLLSPEGSRMLGHAEDLNTEANAALQALLLVSAMNLTGKKPPGSSLKLASRKSIGLSKADTKKRLLLIATMGEILHQKSNTFEDKKLAGQLAKIHKDLNKMVADF